MNSSPTTAERIAVSFPHDDGIHRRSRRVRRALDVAASAMGILVLSPIFLTVAFTVKFHDGGPILYRARRVGRHGRSFLLNKCRTMIPGAGKNGVGITSGGDKRITSIGRLLRRTKIDELPQLINVLKGEMSLVGPRPEDPRYVALYTDEQRRILEEKPGITSAASLAFRYEEELLTGPDWEEVYRTQIMPRKLAIDLAYMERRTMWSDLKIIVRSIGHMFR